MCIRDREKPLLLLTYRPEPDTRFTSREVAAPKTKLASVPEELPLVATPLTSAAPSPPRIEELEEWEALAGGSFALSFRNA